jgi:hypothetical protein
MRPKRLQLGQLPPAVEPAPRRVLLPRKVARRVSFENFAHPIIVPTESSLAFSIFGNIAKERMFLSSPSFFDYCNPGGLRRQGGRLSEAL